MPYKCTIPHIYHILSAIPPADQPKDLARFWQTLAEELSQLVKYASEAAQPQIVLAEVRKADSQYIWEFWVNDLARPQRQAYNWHAQNVSQWLYAGAIVLQNGEVSTHH